MNQHDTLQELDEIAGALHRVLGDEFEALKRLDAAAVERAASLKEVLIEKLAALRSKLPDQPQIRNTLGRIQLASRRTR